MRNMLQFVVRLLCVAAFLCLGPNGIWAQADVWNGSDIATQFAGGDGNDGTPYQIATAAQLAYLAQQVNAGTSYEGKYFQLTNDIDLNNKEWTPIGTYNNPFKGTFDGNAKTIKNLKRTNYTFSYNDYAGLFGKIENATIQKLTVIISNDGIIGDSVGGITGEAAGSTEITNCCVLGGPINASFNSGGDASAGGILGIIRDGSLNISFCCANVNKITATLPGGSGHATTGGIVGYYTGGSLSITNCMSFTSEMKAATSSIYTDRDLNGIIGKSGYSASSLTLSNNYSNPLCTYTTVEEMGTSSEKTETKKKEEGTVENSNGAALTPENSRPNGAALSGWEAQGWTLKDGYLPKISKSAPDTPLNIIEGSEGHPYLITSVEDLEYVATQINRGAANFNGKEYYRLENDIDLAGKEWTPIGTLGNRFKGTFDGKGYCISGLKINISSSERIYTGLFGFVSGGTIQNLGVSLHKDGIRVQTTNSVFCGGIAGATEGQSGCIRNCYVVGMGSIESIGNLESVAGGIVGENSRPVSHCYTTVNVKSNKIAGGISGSSKSVSAISYSFATGTIEITGNMYVGGITGYLAPVSHCLALNKDIKGEGSNIYRIADSDKLSNNYASPKTKIKGTPINQTRANHKDGSDDIDIGNYTTVLINGGGTEWNTAWELGDGSSLPKLKIVSDNSGTLSYTNWPDGSPQPTLKAIDYLPIDKIANNGGGDGKNAPIEITNLDELEYLAIKVNAKKDLKAGTATITNSDGFKDYKFILSNNIDLSAGLWTPIGNSSNPFSASFDGNNKTITLGIKADAKLAQAGLFGTIDTGAKVEKLAVNVTSDGITSTASDAPSNAGAIAAINKGTINQCYVTGDGFILSANGSDSYAGGIAGSNSGTISNCYNLITVKLSQGTNVYTGGIVGYNTGTTSSCFAAGKIILAQNTSVSSVSEGPDNEKAGGIAGFNDHNNEGIVKNCVAVNGEIPSNANRVIGTGGDADDINFSYNDMPRSITKAADTYDPLEGTALTKENANSDTDGCFNGWDATAWNLDAIGTSMPKLKVFAVEQHSLTIAPYLLYSVMINTVTNGTLSVTRPGSAGGSEDVSTDAMVPYNTELTITATPEDTYEIDELTVGGAAFTSGKTHQVTDNVTVNATFKKIEYTVKINKTGEGDLSITYPNPSTSSTGTPIKVNDGSKVPINTELTITATPASGHILKTLTVNGGNFTNGTTHTVADNVTVEATFEAESVGPDPIEPDPTPTPPQPTVYYTVTLPSVEGAVTDPVAGDYEVESWSSFRFYLTLDSAYNQSVPVVTTDRGETLTPRTSDGAYIVDYVRSDVEIYISDIVKNPDPVANEAIFAAVAKVWKTNNHLHMQSPVDADAYIYTAAGKQHIFCKLKASEVKTIQLLPGVYFVRIGDESFKIAM